MWWAGSETLDVFVGARRYGVASGDELLHADQSPSPNASLDELAKWFGTRPRRARARVWLSGALCRCFIQAAVGGAKPDELDRIAEAEAPRRTGLTAPCAIWTEPAATDKARVVVAVSSPLLESILEWRQTTRKTLKVVSIRPWWSSVLETVLAQNPECPALAVDDQESLTVLAGPAQDMAAATTLDLGFGAEGAAAARQRALFTLGLDEQGVRSLRLAGFSNERRNSANGALALGAWVVQA